MSPQFNPYSQQYPYMMQNQSIMNPQNQSILPQQQVTQVNGKASVDAIRMSPNSSILLMDNTAPLVYLCVSDGLGNVTSTAYDIKLHEDAPPVDVRSLEDRVASIESIISKWEDRNAKSNDASIRQKQNTREHQSDKANV